MGSGPEPQPVVVARDIEGHLAVAGNIATPQDFDPGPSALLLSPSGNADIFISRMSPTGNPDWAFTIGNPAGVEKATAIATSPASDVFVTGLFGEPTDFDPGAGVALVYPWGMNQMFLAKYDSLGNFKFVIWLEGTGIVQAHDMISDAAGNLYLAGDFNLLIDFDPDATSSYLYSAAPASPFVMKLDANGYLLWVNPVEITGGQGKATHLLLDPAGNLMVAGAWSGTADFDPGSGLDSVSANPGGTDIFLLRYAASGNYLGKTILCGSGTATPAGLDRDSLDGFVLTGTFTDSLDTDPSVAPAWLRASAGGSDVFAARYVWPWNHVRSFSLGSSASEIAADVACEPGGGFFLSGMYEAMLDVDPGSAVAWLPHEAGQDFFVAEFGPDDSLLTATSFKGPGNELSGFIELENSGALFISGLFSSPMMDADPGPDSLILINDTTFRQFLLRMNVCIPPLITDYGASDVNVCAGDPVTLSVNAGLLNSSTLWQWYADSCGGIPVGAGWSITVFPSDTTTYFVRGEGGCGRPGTCMPGITVFTEICIGTSDPAMNPIAVYPNPAETHILVSAASGQLPEQLNLVAPDGRVVLAAPAHHLSEIQINISGLPSGVYLLTDGTGKSGFRKRITIL